MNQNPNYPPGSNPNNPGGNYGTSYGANYPGSGPNPSTNPNPYSTNPYPQNPPSGPNPNTDPNRYNPNPYPQNPPSGPNPYDPYAPTVASSGAYPGYNPTTPIPPAAPPTFVPPAPPTPPTRPRSRLFSARVLILIGLALVIALAGIVVFGIVLPYQTTQTNDAHATATAQTRAAATAQAQAIAASVAATATVSAHATATAVASNYPFSSNLVLNDPLFDNSHGNQWDEGANATGGRCQFTEGTYRASEGQPGYYFQCFAAKTDFSNFTYQVKMKIITGDAGALLFRADAANTKYYYLEIRQDGYYEFDLFTSSAHYQKLTSGFITDAVSGYYTGLNQSNVIGVVAQGNSLQFYANGQRFAQVTDSTYSHGAIGVAGEDDSSSTDVAYTDAMVWNLGS